MDDESIDSSGGERGPRGIQSVEVGGQLLLALAHQGRPMALKDLAREAGMAPAKAHPYLVSFGKLGLIEQDTATGRYGLGPLALQLGLISLQQFDPVRLATPVLDELAEALGLTVAIAVKGNRGATIVQRALAPTALNVNVQHGTVLSERGTASGLLFAAYGSPARPRDAELARVRERGYSHVDGGALPGISAIAAPIFDAHGSIVLSLTAIGPTPLLSGDKLAAAASQLQRSAEAVSRRLGWSG